MIKKTLVKEMGMSKKEVVENVEEVKKKERDLLDTVTKLSKALLIQEQQQKETDEQLGEAANELELAKMDKDKMAEKMEALQEKIVSLKNEQKSRLEETKVTD